MCIETIQSSVIVEKRVLSIKRPSPTAIAKCIDNHSILIISDEWKNCIFPYHIHSSEWETWLHRLNSTPSVRMLLRSTTPILKINIDRLCSFGEYHTQFINFTEIVIIQRTNSLNRRRILSSYYIKWNMTILMWFFWNMWFSLFLFVYLFKSRGVSSSILDQKKNVRSTNLQPNIVQ